MTKINTPKLLAIIEDAPTHGEFLTKYSLYKGEYFQVEIGLEYEWGELDPEDIQVFDKTDLTNKAWQLDMRNTWSQVQSMSVPLGEIKSIHPNTSNFNLTIVASSHTVQLSWTGELPDKLSPINQLVNLMKNPPLNPN